MGFSRGFGSGTPRRRSAGVSQECPDSSKTAFPPNFGPSGREIAIPTGFLWCTCLHSSMEKEEKEKKIRKVSGFGIYLRFLWNLVNFQISNGGMEGLTRGWFGNKWKLGLWEIPRCGKDPAILWKWPETSPCSHSPFGFGGKRWEFGHQHLVNSCGTSRSFQEEIPRIFLL